MDVLTCICLCVHICFYRVAAGAIAKVLLREVCGADVIAYVSQVRDVHLSPLTDEQMHSLSLEQVEANIARCPDEEVAAKMVEAIDEVRVRGESCGGVLTLVCRNLPPGLGDPWNPDTKDDPWKAVMAPHRG